MWVTESILPNIFPELCDPGEKTSYYHPSDGVWYFQKGNEPEEITEAEAFEIMNSYAHVVLPEMKPVKDFPMN